MEVPPESSSGSLTSRSTPMELDAFEQETPARSPVSANVRDTPTLEDAANGIIVDAPKVEIADSSALLINPDEDEVDEVITPYHKRKRHSATYNIDDSPPFDGRGDSPNITAPIVKRSKPSSKGLKVRGIKIGVWRDSSEENDAEKHVIYGFIDVHDRLRTRIYGMNHRNEELTGNLPMGAGGCWITFPKIIFDSHLVSLNAAEVKEYVRIRTVGPEAMMEATPEYLEDVVRRAKAVVAQDVASGISKPIVHRTAPRKSASRQSLTKATSFQAINSEVISTPKGSFYEGKPQGVLLGYWILSEEPNVEDRHAMYGVLAASDCFRAKVQRITVDGRYVDSNFPTGAGAMWRAYEEIVFLPHLADLTRLEIKEYCRIRLKEQEQRESDKERKANELRAVAQAKAVCAEEGLNNKNLSSRPHPLEMETRHSSRSEQKMKAKEQAELEAAMEKARQLKNAAMERQHAKAREDIAANTRQEFASSSSRQDILSAKARHGNAANEAAIQEAAKQELKNNLKKLNRVWVAQQNITHSHTPPHASGTSSVVSSDEVKYHHGIKYERKSNGPFAGKLATSPMIFNIDGEDYIEYRVLMKPSF